MSDKLLNKIQIKIKNKQKGITFKQKELQKENKVLKEIEQAHKEENGKLRVELEKKKNKNKVIEIFRKDMPKDTEIICMRKEDFERNFKKIEEK